MENGLLEIKKHTLHKYNILRKYLGACKSFQNKYDNFAYVETHGGSGKVLLGEDVIDGSVLIAMNELTWPSFIIEIDNGRFSKLTEFTEDRENIKLFHGDCNEKIDEVLNEIPRGKRFVLFFVDPSSLIYEEGEYVCHQILYETMKKIADVPRAEILMNFPLEVLTRCGSILLSEHRDRLSKNLDHVDKFFGKVCDENCKQKLTCNGKEVCDKWKKIFESRDEHYKMIRNLLGLYIDKVFNGFEYTGAYLIRTSKNVPQYYLLFATHHPVGAKIMKGIMQKEWGFEPPWINFEKRYPMERFVFD